MTVCLYQCYISAHPSEKFTDILMEQILNGMEEKFLPQSDLWKHTLCYEEKIELTILFPISTKINFT